MVGIMLARKTANIYQQIGTINRFLTFFRKKKSKHTISREKCHNRFLSINLRSITKFVRFTRGKKFHFLVHLYLLTI